MKIYEDSQVALVITGVPRVHALSTNRKTGPMAQAWVLPRRDPPTHPRGQNRACGSCPLSPANNGGCYVVAGQAPLAVWRKYVLGEEPVCGVPDMPLGVRVTAWGDPAMVPLEMWEQVLSRAAFHTGYTHQWRGLDPLDWGWLMASVESVEDAELAWELGWRTFRIMEPDEKPDRSNEAVCPSVNGDIQCFNCGLCCGTRQNKRSIAIPVHGSQAVKVFRRKESNQ